MTYSIASRLVASCFSGWSRLGIPYVVLRNASELVDGKGNDIDVLLSQRDARLAEEHLVRVALENGYVLSNRAAFGPLSLFFAHIEFGHQLQFDLFTRLNWRGFEILPPEEVLGARRTSGQVSVPHPVHEACLNLLTRLLFHGYVKEKYRRGIQAAFSDDRVLASTVLTGPFGESAARYIVDRVLKGAWSDIEAPVARWRRLLIVRRLGRDPSGTVASLTSDARRLLRRYSRPPGLMVVMLGPDGSGKSSLAVELMNRLAPTFKPGKSAHVHWKPRLRRRGQYPQTVASRPHSRPTRHPALSLAYFVGHCIEFALGAELVLRPILFRNGLVVIDRYFHDLFIDPKRYRLEVPAGVLAFAFRFIMKPDLVFCLDAPVELLQSRKQEVPPEETERQRFAYLKFVASMRNAHVVDASQSLHHVAGVVQNTVVMYLAERTAQRLSQERSS